MADRSSWFMGIAYLAGLGLLGSLLRTAPPPPPAGSASATETLPPLEVPRIAVNNIAAYDAIVERPLFNPDRRPAVAERARPDTGNEAPAPVEEVDGLRLAAILKGLGSTTALIEDGLGMTRSLRAGERIGNWELQEILDDRVVLSAEGRRQTLRVYRFDDPGLHRQPASRLPPVRRPAPPRGPVTRIAPPPSAPRSADDPD